MNRVIEGLYGWDAFGDCEHPNYDVAALKILWKKSQVSRAHRQMPQVNVPLIFGVMDGLTEKTSLGARVNIADRVFQDEEQQDRITKDVEFMVGRDIR